MTDPPTLDRLTADLAQPGITRVRSFAWRDLDDPDAGGSEVHADEIFRRWHEAGLRVEHRTSAVYRNAQVRSRTLTLPQFVKNIVQVPLMEDPGTRYRYSESTTVLGRLVEIWSGERFDTFLQTRIFAPLRMPDTGFYATPAQRPRLAKVAGRPARIVRRLFCGLFVHPGQGLSENAQGEIVGLSIHCPPPLPASDKADQPAPRTHPYRDQQRAKPSDAPPPKSRLHNGGSAF